MSSRRQSTAVDDGTVADGSQRGDAHTSAGEHEAGLATGGLRVDQTRDEPGRDRFGQQASVAMDDDLGCSTHFLAAASAAGFCLPAFELAFVAVFACAPSDGSNQMCSRLGDRLLRPLIPVQAERASE